ncbi:MAG: hypothetical protein Q7J34_06545 [Bacteroidales bacterium]|nr:hypothetical protein [Bacteroidales bacterium]
MTGFRIQNRNPYFIGLYTIQFQNPFIANGYTDRNILPMTIDPSIYCKGFHPLAIPFEMLKELASRVLEHRFELLPDSEY